MATGQQLLLAQNHKLFLKSMPSHDSLTVFQAMDNRFCHASSPQYRQAAWQREAAITLLASGIPIPALPSSP